MPDETTLTAPAADASDASDTGTAPAAPSEDPTAKLIADYQKRQAGADNARLEAERIAKAAQAELAALKAGKAPKATSDDEPDFDARLKEIEAKYAAKADEVIAKVTGDALNARFPAARAKFPEITDTVKLAELEAIFGESSAPPAPVGNNPPRTQAPATKNVEDMTVAEREVYLRTAFDKSVLGL